MYTIVAINPGSTSTKVAIYNDDKVVRELTLRHSAEEIARFDDIISQLDWRREIILSALREQHFDIRELAVVIGRGVEWGGQRWWFDRNGKPYSEKEVRALELPLLTLGNCAENLADAAKWRTPGCCSPSVCMLAATAAMGIPFPLLSLKNQAFFHFGFQAVRMALTRCVLSLRGVWIDCPSLHKDQIYPAPAPAPGQEQLDFVPWPLPKMGWKMRLKLAGDQLRILKL